MPESSKLFRMLPGQDERQRSADHPAARALLCFLEADLERGMRLARQAALERDSGRPLAPELVFELEAVSLEVLRWLDCARQRNLRTGRLRLRADQLALALGAVRRTCKHRMTGRKDGRR